MLVPGRPSNASSFLLAPGIAGRGAEHRLDQSRQRRLDGIERRERPTIASTVMGRQAEPLPYLIEPTQHRHRRRDALAISIHGSVTPDFSAPHATPAPHGPAPRQCSACGIAEVR